MKQIYRQVIGGSLYVFDFTFDMSIVEFCRALKEEYSRDEFFFDVDAKKWRFNNLEIVDKIVKQYPETTVSQEMCSDLIIFEKNKKSKMSETANILSKEIKSSSDLTGLRGYQAEALDAILSAIRNGDEGNHLVVLPTGAGKSILISSLVHILNNPVLILQPSKEILTQNYFKLLKYVNPHEIGIYSASMNEKTIRKMTFATIQSIYKKAEFFKHFKFIIIDECHLFSPTNFGGMFTTFLRHIGDPKVLGLTATPYRMATSYKYIKAGQSATGRDELYAYTTIKLINRIKGRFWQNLLYNTNIQELINKGFLCPLEYYDKSLLEHEDIPLNKSHSEFDLEKYEDLISSKQIKILKVIQYAESISKSVLVFCSSVKQAKVLSGIVTGASVVTAKTPAAERDLIIKRFKEGKIKTVFNVGVLTTGFDHPSLDCIVLLRPTRSIGLYYQMVGRGVRIFPGKTSCKVIDLTSTVKSLGKIETIRLEKINGNWELLSEAGSWHNKELYRFQIKQKTSSEEDEKVKKRRSILI